METGTVDLVETLGGGSLAESPMASPSATSDGRFVAFTTFLSAVLEDVTDTKLFGVFLRGPLF
jgi:hypothetical protein